MKETIVSKSAGMRVGKYAAYFLATAGRLSPSGGGWREEKMLINKTLILIFHFSFFIFHSLTAQNKITANDFISTAMQDPQLLLHQRQLDFLKNTDYKMPWADELEFRTETDEMDLDRQEYLLRFRYNSKAERNSRWNLHQSDIQLQEVEKTLLLEEALMDRYFLLAKYIFVYREINLLKAQQLVGIDKINVLRKKATALAEVDLNDLLTTEENNHEMELDLFKLENELQQLNKLISRRINTVESIELDTSGFLSFSELKDKIQQLPKDAGANYVFTKRQVGLEKNRLEFEKEKADNSWKIDYVQFKHAGRDRLNFAREWAFGMGVEIPLKDAGRLQRNDIMLDRIEMENRIELQQKELSERLQEKFDELDLKLKEHELVTRQLSDSQLQYSSDTYPQYRDADPLILLNIKSNLLKRQEDQLEIEEDVYWLYLEIIELSGKAVELPLRNYLTDNWGVLNN
ncbi:MAG: hypothetical protein AAFZ15_05870 [Bacteroidota bacterium]